MGNCQTVDIQPEQPQPQAQPQAQPRTEYINDFVNLSEDEKTVVTTYITETVDEIKEHVKYDNVPISFTFPVALKVNENKYFYLENALSGKCLHIKHSDDMKKYNEHKSYHKLFYIVNNKIKEYTNKPYTISTRNGQYLTYSKEYTRVTSMATPYKFADDKANKRYGMTRHPDVTSDMSYDVFYIDVLFIQ
jgi:hypothetical protein